MLAQRVRLARKARRRVDFLGGTLDAIDSAAGRAFDLEMLAVVGVETHVHWLGGDLAISPS